jgi:hypothetical protein
MQACTYFPRGVAEIESASFGVGIAAVVAKRPDYALKKSAGNWFHNLPGFVVGGGPILFGRGGNGAFYRLSRRTGIYRRVAEGHLVILPLCSVSLRYAAEI